MISRVRRSKAFTLVELLIVILILAVLMAVAIPAFLGSRQRAGDRAAQQTVRTAVSSVKAYASEADNFNVLQTTTTPAATTASKMKAAEPNINWQETEATPSGNTRQVAVSVAADTPSKTAYLVSNGADGQCWAARLSFATNVTDGYATWKNTNTAAACTLADAPSKTYTAEFPARG